MHLITLSDIQKAAKAFEGKYRIPIDQLGDQSLEKVASVITPEHLDAADLFVLLAEPDRIYEDDQALASQVLKQALDYPQTDPNGVSVELSTLKLDYGSMIAKTIIRPDNLDTSKDPIVFAGGIFHNAPVYLDFLTKIAKATGREICAFDSPGVGASRFDDKTFTYEIWRDSMPQVIRSQYGPDKSVLVFGHSLGSVTARNIFYEQEIEGNSIVDNPVSKYVLLAPVPALAERMHGNSFSLPYMVDGVVGMQKNKGYLAPGSKAYDFYFGEHAPTAWSWMDDRIGHERMPAKVPPYLKTLRKVTTEPLWKHLEHEKLAYVLMENDNVFPCKNVDRWEEKGAHVIRGADHSGIAGEFVSDDIVQQFIAIIEEP